MSAKYPTWLLYGATGFTGELILQIALERGHRPILGGRNADKLAALAKKYGLDYAAFGLETPDAAAAILQQMPVVVNAAGPFVRTAPAMIEACLRSRTHYLDITGEALVFEQIYRQHAQAQAAGIALVPGMGFDVVPTDCLAAWVAGQVPGATQLDIAIKGSGAISGGTLTTVLEHFEKGHFVRSNGQLKPQPLATPETTAWLGNKPRQVFGMPLADISSAYRSTGVPNINTYMALAPKSARRLQKWGKALQKVLGWSWAKRFAQGKAHSWAKGPTAQQQANARNYCWARAIAPNGKSLQAQLETIEAYRLTAWCSVLGAEHLMQAGENAPTGALSPSQAFGETFVLEVPGCKWEIVQG